jgi:two-component system, NtrC family, sensor kinase
MKFKLSYILLVITISGLSSKAFGQIDVDSLQKTILESIKQGLDNKAFSNPYFDTSKMFKGKSPVNLDKLFKQLDIDLKAAKLEGDIDKVEDGYRHLSKVDSMRGNYKGAYENFKLYSLYRDSLQKKEAENKRLQYEFEKKQAIAKAEQEKKDTEAKRVKNLQYFTIAGLAALVLVILAIALIQWRNSRQRKQTNTLLQSEKEKVESTLSELKSAQAQLIQSEKMASLGELTAGIAHEIQNPLNFVNNFSEVNKELAEELKSELASDSYRNGNSQLAAEIISDIKENSEKINHHGKRADAIVKGMLQHSRMNSGTKESTDINALADEYLRIAWHGLQARDKSFNATIKTDFDESIGNINIVPEDIGRVLLNLYNNAFYAVNEKAKQDSGSYEPTVTVKTQKIRTHIEIKVSDNGNGIPQAILEKIFQPFFTTKPTGQGTGLGLSLSYDIVKAHGGEISAGSGRKAETKEEQGSEFVITLPYGKS